MTELDLIKKLERRIMKKYTLTIPLELLEKCKNNANQKGMSLNEYILLLISKRLKDI